jgi:uncharacterized protein YvpB
MFSPSGYHGPGVRVRKIPWEYTVWTYFLTNPRMKTVLILLPVFVSALFAVSTEVREGTTARTTDDRTAKTASGRPVVAADSAESSGSDTPEAAEADPIDDLPATAKLDVPFTTQAPFENWNMPFQEACEETSVIMVQYYLQGITPMQETVRDQIIAITDYEAGYGYAHDLSIEDTAKIAEEFYGLGATTYHGEEVTVEKIKSLVADGNPVIIPALGQDLNNPHFRGDGPPYHMIVVVGYDTEGFITHDPGTKFGEGYHYSYAVIMGAIHDWTGSRDTLEHGDKSMLVLTKK